MSDDDNKMDTSEAALVSLHLQPFWPTSPRDWFNHAEILFDVKGIKTDKMKWGQVIASLPPSVMSVISDVLAKPPADNKYEFIKTILLERLQPSEERRMEALLAGQDLGDRRPSEALRHIRGLAGDRIGESVVRSIWIRRLPEVIKITMLSQLEDASLEVIAKLADRLYEAITPSTMLAAIQQHPPVFRQSRNPKPTSSSGSLESRMSNLEAKVNTLSNMLRSRSRSTSRNMRKPSGAYNVDPTSELCFYHKMYKHFARKCIPPCKWTGADKQNKPGPSKPGNKTTVSKNE